MLASVHTIMNDVPAENVLAMVDAVGKIRALSVEGDKTKKREINMINKTIIRDLGDGLILRHAIPEDEEALVKFNREIHGEGDWDEKGLEEWDPGPDQRRQPNFQTRRHHHRGRHHHRRNRFHLLPDLPNMDL